jgi:hypothetical protein
VSDLAVISQPGALDEYADAGAFIIHSCERAKDWLTQCIALGEIDEIVELKSQAEAIRVYTTTKQLGRDAELAAAEIVRRAERGIGVCIRKGQAEGTIAARGHNHAQNSMTTGSEPRLTSEFAKSHELAGGGNQPGIYAFTDGVTDEQFDEAIDEAKAEGNLSRANVARKAARKKVDTGNGSPEKVQTARDMAAAGSTSRQIAEHLGYESLGGLRNFLARHGIEVPADKVFGRTQGRRIDSNRIVTAAVESVIGIGDLFHAIDYSELDDTQFDYWVRSLTGAIKSLTTLRNNIKKEQTQ